MSADVCVLLREPDGCVRPLWAFAAPYVELPRRQYRDALLPGPLYALNETAQAQGRTFPVYDRVFEPCLWVCPCGCGERATDVDLTGWREP